MTVSLLAARGLRKAFGGVEALRCFDLTLARGEVVALIGPNGAGKSTAFNLLDGQLRPDAGVVEIGGENVTRLGPRARWRRGLGRTFQVATAFASLTVREMLETARLVRSRGGLLGTGAVARRRTPEVETRLAAVGLADHADRPAAALAYGDLKRLDLALALAGDPTILLMDEPAAGMAPAERHALMGIVVTAAQRDGLAVLFTEHDLEIVFGYAARVVVLSRGAVMASGPPNAVRQLPAVREAYLGVAPC